MSLLSSDEISYLLKPETPLSPAPDILEHRQHLSEHDKKLINGLAKTDWQNLKIRFESTKKGQLKNLNQVKLFAFSNISNVDNCAILGFSDEAVNIIINFYLGGTMNVPDTRHNHTNIELGIISLIAQKIYTGLGSEFSIETNNHIVLQPIEETDFTQIFLVSRMRLEAKGYAGKLYVALPYQNRSAQSGHRKNYLSEYAADIPLTLTAVLFNKLMMSNELDLWEKGHIIPLHVAKNAEIAIMNENKPVLKGITGRKNNKIAVQITKKG